MGGLGGVERIEQKRKTEKELRNKDNSVVITGGREWVEVDEGMRDINGDGKKFKKIN